MEDADGIIQICQARSVVASNALSFVADCRIRDGVLL